MCKWARSHLQMLIQQFYTCRLYWQNGYLGTEVEKWITFSDPSVLLGSLILWLANFMVVSNVPTSQNSSVPIWALSSCIGSNSTHVYASLEQLEGGTSPFCYWIRMNVAISQQKIIFSTNKAYIYWIKFALSDYSTHVEQLFCLLELSSEIIFSTFFLMSIYVAKCLAW
jgi:hypothetical protein